MAALARPLGSSPFASNVASCTPLEALFTDVTSRGLGVLLHALLAAEADEYVSRYAGLRDELGRALVARNGVARTRLVPIGPVTVWVSAPRVNDRRVIEGDRQRFTSALLPPNKAPCIGPGARLASAYAQFLATADPSLLFVHLAPAAQRFGVNEVREALANERESILSVSLGDVRFERVVAARMASARLSEVDEGTVLYGIRPSGGVELIALDLSHGEEVTARLVREANARGVDTSRLVLEGSERPSAVVPAR